MKPNIVVALLVGLVVGFAVGKLVTTLPSSRTGTPSSTVTNIQVPEDHPTSEAALKIKPSDMPAETFAGLTDPQKLAVMKVMNEEICDCGCDKGTLAECLKNDPNCPNSPAKLKQAIELAKAGKNAAQIKAEMFGSGTAKTTAKAAPARPDDSAVFKVTLDGAPVSGKPFALVTIVEFSDYQCPFCSRANETVEQIQKEYGPRLRVAMKQNPLPFHPNAKPAALAALSAGEQGKYWEMHEKLFKNQQALDQPNLEKYAKEIGLDVAKWKQSLANPKFQEVIAHDQAQAQELGASGTPAFFINGRKLSGAQPKESFKKIIDEELVKAEAMVKDQHLRPDQVYAKIMETAVTNPAPSAQSPRPTPPPAATVVKIDVPAEAPAKGPKTAKVTIVEWSDFQCPFCSRAIPVLKQIEDTYGKDVRVVFRHQPLPFHQNAPLAAEASLAAHEQGKFWEYHDKLFANQTALDRPALEKYAQELGLDVPKFKNALDGGKFKARVSQDSAAGTAAGANGTPTFFVNGRKVVGALPFESFKPVIETEMAKADKLLASGTKPEGLYDKLMAEASAAPPEPAAPPSGSAAPSPAAVQNINLAQAPTKGPKTAPVTIVEWSDFQCPFCSRAVPTLKAIEEQYKGKVKFAFKHQPLPFHSNAKGAAMAAMAANEQGKFWEYHDKLFANQTALDRASLEKYAQELGLNMTKFKSALDSNKFESIISADSEEGTKVGARGTPTFFINGRQLVGAQPVESFKTIIDDELQKKTKTAKK